MTLTISTPPEFQAEKYCNGCKRWLSVELFGVRSATRSKLSPRCLECNAEYTRKYYYENFDKIAARNKQYRLRNNPPKQKPTFIKLELRDYPGSTLNKCPHCGGLVSIGPDQIEGFCEKSKKKYHVKRHLSATKLEAEFQKRDYEREILDYIRRRQRTCATEIVSGVRISKGKVSEVIHSLMDDGLVRVTNMGCKKWIEIVCESQ